MKILFIQPYPTEGASARYRVEQYVPYLENNGISWWKLTPKQQEALQQAQTGALAEQKKPDELLAQANV